MMVINVIILLLVLIPKIIITVLIESRNKFIVAIGFFFSIVTCLISIYFILATTSNYELEISNK